MSFQLVIAEKPSVARSIATVIGADEQSLHTASVFRFFAIIASSHSCFPLRFFTLFTWCISSGTLVFPHSSHTRADSLSSNDVLEPMCAIAKSMILSVQRSVFLQSINLAKLRRFIPAFVWWGTPQPPFPSRYLRIIFLLVLSCFPARVFRCRSCAVPAPAEWPLPDRAARGTP